MKKLKGRSKSFTAFFLTTCMVVASAAPVWAAEGPIGGYGGSGTGSVSCDSSADAEQHENYISNEYIVCYDDFFSGNEESEKSSRSAAEKRSRMLMEQPEVLSVELQPDTDDGNEAQTEESSIALIRVDEDLSGEDEEAFIEKLENEPGVMAVEKNRVVYALGGPDKDNNGKEISALYSAAYAGVTDDVYSEQQYALTSVRADEAWDMIDYTTAAKVKVAVVDTGVDASHPDLQGKVLPGYNCLEYNSAGKKYSSDDTSDDNSHGTHVAGIIAAISNNNMGISGVTGALDVQILPVKVLDDEGTGTTYDIVKAIKYAADNGADFINLSLGSNYPSELEEAAVDYALSKGTLCIAAAGNESTDVSSNYPAAYDNVMSVGSIDSQDERSYFSNYGKGLDLTAPGSSILSTVPEACVSSLKAEGYTVYGNALEGYYAKFSGTSMATPCAVGVAAVYKAVNPTADCSDIRQHLNETARDICDIGFDIYTGNGCIDAAAALGEPIKQIAVRLKSPKTGDEIYEKVSVRFQVNTSMGIDSVNIYMNEISENKKIGEVKVSEDQAVYDYILDTKKFNDGGYTIIIQAVSEDETPIGDPASADSVNIVNTIPDGFVIEATDPAGDPAAGAAAEVYGMLKDGSAYELISSNVMTDLGYERINDLDPEGMYSSYSIRITGNYRTSGHMSYYSYWLPDVKTGSKITADKTSASAEKVEFSMKGADGNEIAEPYLMLAPIEKIQNEGSAQELNDLPIWTMYEDSEIYVSKGDYHFETYWSPSTSQTPDYSKPGYYLTGQTSVTDDKKQITADCSGAGILRGEFGSSFDGVLEVYIDSVSDKIPFLPGGSIKGKVLYLSPDKYAVKAVVSKEIDGEIWSVTLEKDESYKVTAGSDQTVVFSAEVKLTKFQPAESSIKTDEYGTLYIYRGDILRTLNEMSVDGDAVISGFSGDYPTFKIYRLKEDGGKELIYSVTDTWQAKVSTWNSGNVSSLTGNLPEAGRYMAQLSFNAGPMGGLSELSFEFELRNRSGSEECDSVVRMGLSSLLPQAEVTLFYWDDDAQGWTNAFQDGGSILYDDNARASFAENKVKLSESGINAAVVKYSYIKQTSSPVASEYKGFQIFYYDSADDLKNITLSDSVSRTYVKVLNKNGEDVAAGGQRINVNIGISSAGNGKLAESRFMTDISLQAGSMYIPDDMYDYISAAFTSYNEEYFLIEHNISTASGSVVIDGRQSYRTSFELPDTLKGKCIYPDAGSGNRSAGSSLDFRSSGVFYWSSGTYTPEAEIISADGSQQITVQIPEFTLDADKEIVIKDDFGASIVLDQNQVNKKQSISGTVYITDSLGNRVIGTAVKKGAVYEDAEPLLRAGAKGTEGKQVDNDSYTDIKISPEYYDGSGEHFIAFSCTVNGKILEAKASFEVTGGNAQSELTIISGAAYDIVKDGGETYALIKSGMEGYRVITVNISAALTQRNIEFRQVRGGKEIASAGVSDIFDDKVNEYSAGFTVKAGDKIIVSIQESNQ